jgi:hypothetical protein
MNNGAMKASAAVQAQAQWQSLFISIDWVTVVADREPAEIEAVNRHADVSRAAITKNELTNAGMHPAEFAGKDAVDHATAGKNIGRTATEGVFDSSDAAGEARP